MDAIPEATDEDAANVPNIIFTFFRWMMQNGRRDSTAKTYARQMIVLFEEDNKSPAGMATEEYFMLVKNSWKNKSGNSQRSASVKQFLEFWSDRGNKPMEDCGNDKRFQIKSRPPRSKAAPAAETEEAKKLRADLELPSEGWSVVVRSRETGDLIAAVSPGGTAYYTREAVDRRLGRKPAGGAEPPPAPLPPAAGKADAAKPAAAEAARPAPAAAEAATEAKKQAKVEEAKKEEARKEEAKKEEAKKAEAKKEEAKKEEAKREEARKEEARKEEAKKEEARKLEANKVEVKKEEVKKEEVKKEEVKEELKEEVKEEVKNAVKEEDIIKKEEKEDIKDDDTLAAFTQELEAHDRQEASERKKKSRKHEDVDTLEGLLNDTQEFPFGDLTTPQVDTDTEYTEEIDLKASPQKIHVRDSGSHKTDGEYTQLLNASRGKPCYVKWGAEGDKTMYMYWNRKWKIGMDFGSSKAYAMVKDAGALVPCEPFPNVWRVIDKTGKKDKKEKDKDKDKKDAKTYVKNLAMRVIDGEVMSLSMGEESLGFIIPSEDGHSTKRAKRRLLSPVPVADEAKGDGKPSAPAKEPVANGAIQSDDGVGPADSDDDEDDKVVEQQQVESSSEESNSSESSSSDSGASDSEDEGRKVEEKKEVKPVAVKPLALHASEQKAAVFETRVRNQLQSMPTMSAKLAKLRTIKEMFTKKMGLENVTGMSSDKVVALLEKLARECGLKPGSLAAPAAPPPQAKAGGALAKPPAGPPPAHLLEKKGPAAAQAAEDQRSLADLYAHAEPPRPSPMTPEQIQNQSQFEEPPATNGAEWWRQRVPKRSALRRPGEPRPVRSSRRISYRDVDGMNYLVNQVDVTSFRSCGEALWFVAPGSYVKCDSCEKEVTQAMGSLQGAPNQSQFAQHCFLCSECSGM